MVLVEAEGHSSRVWLVENCRRRLAHKGGVLQHSAAGAVHRHGRPARDGSLLRLHGRRLPGGLGIRSLVVPLCRLGRARFGIVGFHRLELELPLGLDIRGLGVGTAADFADGHAWHIGHRSLRDRGGVLGTHGDQQAVVAGLGLHVRRWVERGLGLYKFRLVEARGPRHREPHSGGQVAAGVGRCSRRGGPGGGKARHHRRPGHPCALPDHRLRARRAEGRPRESVLPGHGPQ
mmetsp:Transcript_78385/g.199255  ORF Transcript_78385/g.199255 Transcript_78385/m.199255 type:complete len:233 (-) Transcript_78385:389-1087(-)